MHAFWGSTVMFDIELGSGSSHEVADGFRVGDGPWLDARCIPGANDMKRVIHLTFVRDPAELVRCIAGAVELSMNLLKWL